MITPNMIEQLPTYFVNNPLYWCLPSNAHVLSDSTEVYLVNQAITGHCRVCPVPMSRGMHHFELRVLEEPIEEGVVPPMIALTTASPYDPPRESNFQLDLLRFWPRNEGERVKLDFDALTIHSHRFTRHNVQQLYSEARQVIEQESKSVALGEDLPFEHKRLQDFYKPLPAESKGDMTPHRLGDIDDGGIHTADHHMLISKATSRLCTIL